MPMANRMIGRESPPPTTSPNADAALSAVIQTSRSSLRLESKGSVYYASVNASFDELVPVAESGF